MSIAIVQGLIIVSWPGYIVRPGSRSRKCTMSSVVLIQAKLGSISTITKNDTSLYLHIKMFLGCNARHK